MRDTFDFMRFNDAVLTHHENILYVRLMSNAFFWRYSCSNKITEHERKLFFVRLDQWLQWYLWRLSVSN